MNQIKNITIKEHFLTAPLLNSIQKELRLKRLALFNEKVVAPNRIALRSWIEEHYPMLMEEIEDISKGVFRRLRNDIMKSADAVKTFDISTAMVNFANLECQGTLPSDKNRQKNLGLDKSDFKKLVAALKNGEETIIEKVYLSQFEKSIAIIVKQTNCTKEKAYDCTMDALIEVRKDLINDKILYGNLGSYFITRALSKYYKKERKKKLNTLPILEELNYSNYIEDQDELIANDLKEMVSKGMKKLGKECQELLRLVYYRDLDMNEIGTKINKSHVAVRKQASRCRAKLKQYFSLQFYRQFVDFFSQ